MVIRINDRRKIILESFSNILITVSLNTTEKKFHGFVKNTTDHRLGAEVFALMLPALIPADGVAPCPLPAGQERAGSYPQMPAPFPRHTHTHTIQHVKIDCKSVD